jgi:hypothetical protein
VLEREDGILPFVAAPVNWQAFALFPAPYSALTAVKEARDLLPGFKSLLGRVSLKHRDLLRGLTPEFIAPA